MEMRSNLFTLMAEWNLHVQVAGGSKSGEELLPSFPACMASYVYNFGHNVIQNGGLFEPYSVQSSKAVLMFFHSHL